MRRACTIIARNYWAHARVLARSLQDQHPDVPLSVLVVDADEPTLQTASRELFDVLAPEDIGIDPRELHRMAAIYDLLELATALKPWLLKHLAADGASVVYLDPDIEIFSAMDQAWELAAEHGIVVTPHTTVPPPREGGSSEELTILGSGTYNLGFIAIGPSAGPFLDWWADRLRRDGLIAKESGMFVDQRWVDLAPSYFDVHILREPGWNVAYWNLPVRRLAREGAQYLVNGEPLRFFHYSGYDPDRPDLLSCYESDPPRTSLDEHPLLAEMSGSYGERLVGWGYRAYTKVPYGYAESAAGLPLDRYARRLYRRELLKAEASGEREPPDPFDARGARAFEAWLREPAAAHRVTRYLRAIYDERADLQASFPDLSGPDARFFMDWARVRARFEPNVAPELVALATGRLRGADDRGVNVAGYVKAESGVGEVARLVVAALDAASVPCSVVPFDKTSSRQATTALEYRIAAPEHPTNIVCVNADQFEGFVESIGDELLSDRRTIAVWQWEVERFPDWMARAESHVDEIWVASQHAAHAVREQTTKAVHVFSLPVVRPMPSSRSRASLGLPEGFIFLFCFDFDSVFERKNPLGVVAAFSRAFPPGSGPQLVIKSVRGDAHPEDLAPLRAAAAERPDIHVLDGYLDRGDQAGLMAACDAYVSLHRAEGFGLTIAEAMALGKPVIATGYSGNLEFMDETNSWLVPYELVPIPQGYDPYPAGALWAKPDIDVAAEVMRRIVNDPVAASERGQRAAHDMARLHSPIARSTFIRQRLRDDPALAEAERARREAEARPWIAVESADVALTTGPDVRSPTSYGLVSRIVRRFVLRIARHYVEHQEKIQASLLDGVRDLEARLRAEIDGARDLEHDVRELSERLDREAHRRRSLESRLTTSSTGAQVIRPSARTERLRFYAGLFGALSPVLAVGREAEDLIDEMAVLGTDAAALDVRGSGGDPFDLSAVLSGLEALADRSLGGIFTVNVIEHLSLSDQGRFLEMARRKLDAGGVLVAEIGDGGESGPQAVLELCRSTGFEQADVLFPGGASDPDGLAQGEIAIVASVLLPTHR